MFNQLLERSFYIKRHQEAPLLKERLKYLKYWSDNGARRSTILVISSYLLVIVEYLKLKNRKNISLTHIKNAAKKWAGRSYKSGKTKSCMLKGVNIFTNLSWEKIAALAVPASAYVINAAIDSIKAHRATTRECSISYLLSLDKLT